MKRTAWARAAFAIALATLWSFACVTNEPGNPACVPGRSLDCTCTDGRKGAQVCQDDGTAFGPCVCGSNADASPSNDATVADANGGDVSPSDDAPSDDVATGSDGTFGDAEGDAGALDATDAAPNDFGNPTAACSFTVANPYNEWVYGVASGPGGRIAAVGYFNATFDAGGVPIDFGDGTKITYPDGSMNGGFVFTLDTSCRLMWARPIEFGAGVAFDSKGNIWTIGVRDGTSIVSILTKFDPLGNILSQTPFGSEAGHVQLREIAVDATDSVVLGGEYAYTPSLGGDPLPYNVTGTFVAKFSSSGAHIWSKGFGGTKNCPRTPMALALDPSGDVFIDGAFGNVGCDISFGGPQFTATGTDWAYAARLSGADGSHLWTEALPGAALYSACVTGSGTIFVAGLVAPGSFDAGGAPGRFISSAYSPQMVCGGSLGERAVVAGIAPLLEMFESDGGVGWDFRPDAAQGYASVASGANRDILFGYAVQPNTSDVYVLRLTR